MKKRILSLFLTLCLLLSLVPMSAQANEITIWRHAGDNRFTTSLSVAEAMRNELGGGQFDCVIVASGVNFADALSGSYLAAVKKAPILLAYKDAQNQQTAAYIRQNLKVGGTVYILGGTAAVPASMDKLLSGLDVRRLDGANRFETNLMILEEAGVKDQQEILVCTATNFADSLSASATGLPILLVYNEKSKLTNEQKEFLSGHTSNSLTIIGGESAVNEELAQKIAAYGKVSRLAGSNRFDTSVKVAETYFTNPSKAVLAYGGNFPDGLCGGPLAYVMGGPLILTNNKYASIAENYTLTRDITFGVVLGGPSLISDKSVIQIFAHQDITPNVPETEPSDPPASQEPTAPPPTDPPLEDSAVPTAQQAYDRMIAMKEQYPEGMSWTNDNYYRWNGGVYSGGYGCAGFAFILSDAAFGTLPARILTPEPEDFYWVNPALIVEDDFFSMEDIHVGDILRINHDSHSVIVLEVHEDHVIIAEGNYNYSIHWGRALYADDIMMADYILTRYPEA